MHCSFCYYLYFLHFLLLIQPFSCLRLLFAPYSLMDGAFFKLPFHHFITPKSYTVVPSAVAAFPINSNDTFAKLKNPSKTITPATLLTYNCHVSKVLTFKVSHGLWRIFFDPLGNKPKTYFSMELLLLEMN